MENVPGIFTTNWTKVFKKKKKIQETATRRGGGGGGTKKSSPRLFFFPALFRTATDNLCTVACFCNTLTVSCFPAPLGLPKEDEDGAAGTFPPPAAGGAAVPRCARVSMEALCSSLFLSSFISNSVQQHRYLDL